MEIKAGMMGQNSQENMPKTFWEDYGRHFLDLKDIAPVIVI